MDFIGKKVRKKSTIGRNGNREPKPFKSGLKINTIKGIIQHPILEGEMAFTFFDDDSYVECRRCVIVEDND